MASVTATYSGDDIVAKQTALYVTCEDVPANTSTGYDDDNYPASPAVTYYFSLELAGQDDLVSQVFTPTADTGRGEWPDIIPPAAGSWELHVRKTEDDSSVADTTLEVI